MTELSKEEWLARGRELFGEDTLKWRFKCPRCGRVISVADWYTAGAPIGAVAFACIGRYVNWAGCDYAGGGLFHLNPVRVTDDNGTMREVFEFAEGGLLRKSEVIKHV